MKERMEERQYGYARVSSRDQNEARQVLALEEFGIKKDDIFCDKQSGKDFDRPQYGRLVNRLRPGDIFVVKSIDRLGRNYEEILEQWRLLTKEKRCAIVVLDMPLLDTRASRDLTGTLIADIVLQLLSYVAQTEREFIRQRQKEGIAAAKARGVRFGAPPKKQPPEFTPLRESWSRGELSARAAARNLGVATATFLTWAHAASPKNVHTRNRLSTSFDKKYLSDKVDFAGQAHKLNNFYILETLVLKHAVNMCKFV